MGVGTWFTSQSMIILPWTHSNNSCSGAFLKIIILFEHCDLLTNVTQHNPTYENLTKKKSFPNIARKKMAWVLTCTSATCCFKPLTYRLHNCFFLSDFRGTENDHEGLRLRGYLHRWQQYTGFRELWSRSYLLSRRLLQQRQHQQHQPAAPGGTVYPSNHFFLRFKDPFVKSSPCGACLMYPQTNSLAK